MNRDIGMLDRAGIEERHHEVEVVMFALHIERHAVLPAIPDGPHCAHILAHPWTCRRPREPIAALDMSFHLRAKTQDETAVTELLDRPGAERRYRRAARKGDGDRGTELQ